MTLAAVLACAESLPLSGPDDVEGEAVDSLAPYKCCDSDHLTLLNMYHAWHDYRDVRKDSPWITRFRANPAALRVSL